MLENKGSGTIGVISGFTGNFVKTLIDEASLKKKVSKRSFRSTAAGVWVSKKSEATNYKTISAFLSAFPQNKVKPKDAASNLSYMVAHAVYGAVTSILVTKLGDSSLFDSEPVNNYLSPTEPTTEVRKIKLINSKNLPMIVVHNLATATQEDTANSALVATLDIN